MYPVRTPTQPSPIKGEGFTMSSARLAFFNIDLINKLEADSPAI
jgi:hypothetical protein